MGARMQTTAQGTKRVFQISTLCGLGGVQVERVGSFRFNLRIGCCVEQCHTEASTHWLRVAVHAEIPGANHEPRTRHDEDR